MVELNLKNIYKKYPNSEHYSVEDFNLDIKDKEFIVFVGPSGCGKSTTLRMIAGLEDITEGECSIDGTVVNNVAPKDRDIAMVFQNYALYPHMTVYDNMAFGLKLRKYSKEDIDKRVQEAAEILGLKEFLDVNLQKRPAQDSKQSQKNFRSKPEEFSKHLGCYSIPPRHYSNLSTCTNIYSSPLPPHCLRSLRAPARRKKKKPPSSRRKKPRCARGSSV